MTYEEFFFSPGIIINSQILIYLMSLNPLEMLKLLHLCMLRVSLTSLAPDLSLLDTTPVISKGFPSDSAVKHLSAMQETQGSIPGSGRPPEEEMATHSSILAQKIT